MTTVSSTTLNVELEFSDVPLGTGPHNMWALATAKPAPECDTPVRYVVLVIDESASMGDARDSSSAINLLHKVLEKFLKDGIPNAERVYLRILGFGKEIIDRQIKDAHSPMVQLTPDTVPLFLDSVRRTDGTVNGTNIDAAIEGGINVLKDHISFMAENEEPPPEAAHVLVLTDGHSTLGIKDAKQLRAVTRKRLAETNTNAFLHVLCLGGNVNSKWIETVLDEGNIGVCAMAPDSSKLSHAFESIFGLALDTNQSFKIRVDGDATTSEKVFNFGMLASERHELFNVCVPRADERGEVEAFRVTLLASNNLEITVPVKMNYVDYHNGEGPRGRNKAVKNALEEKAVIEEQEAILEANDSLSNTQAKLRRHAASVSDRGYGWLAMKRVHDTVEEHSIIAESPQWRSLEDSGAEASQLYASAHKCQRKYGR